MNDNEYWVRIWAIIALVICAFLASLNIYYTHKNELVATMLEQGTDPLKLKCATDDSFGSNPVCVILATKQ